MTLRDDPPILLCYDRSDGARRAIECAAGLFPGARALVLTVWSFSTLMRVYGAGEAAAYSESATRAQANRDAVAGCAVACAVGLDASPIAACGSQLGTWRTILSVADDHDASVIVVGTRGISGLHSLVLGSISQGVLQHSKRPVLVVPAGTYPQAEAAEAPGGVASRVESLR
jgi:nucleotide-binding universal stress UspA family protein